MAEKKPKKDIKPINSEKTIGSLAERRKRAMDEAIDGPPRKKVEKKEPKPMKCGGKVKKMAKGGKVPCCRGMGAASRGGRYSKSG